ncbi:DUF3667 domain-containing protein [Erythrobacter sp. T5W1-R]|uniref:DUF3667 domain-containing protein n=1 Tax=Erythrobacter sp. T5W1-R TaxID=3101752 RepID=UPI002AFF0540|nr:DUF3667 domain-containing protein [Erythrobacter sp. T5W1-R]MEA1618618.1 DUF3667 domain-containing protein [Erythrobacter sp. T5W1-R]
MGEAGEAIGECIEGGPIGRTAELGVAGSAASAATPVTCANCCTVHHGDFCPKCGQKAHLHNSLAAIGHDLIHGVLHLDGKLWDTLPLLAFKPGELTRRYVAGERAKFVSPMAMFLFSVFAMFAVFQMVGISAPTDIQAERTLPREMQDAKDRLKSDIAALQAKISEIERQGTFATAEKAELKQMQKELAVYEEARSIILSESLGSGFTFTKTDIELIDDVFEKWRKNPSLMMYKIQANAYKFSWLLIPLSIPFLFLLFLRAPHFKAYAHAIFVTYSLSFMSLLFIAISILSAIGHGAGWVGAVLFAIAAPLHLYTQLRHAYGISYLSALWRLLVLLVFMMFVMGLFLLGIGLLGAF